jgi:hypothetical protein
MFNLERAVPAHPLFARKGEASPSAGLSCREVKFGQLPPAFVPTPAPAPMPTPMLADMQADMQADVQADVQLAPAESPMAGLIRRHTVDPEALARVPSQSSISSPASLRAAVGVISPSPALPLGPLPMMRPAAPTVAASSGGSASLSPGAPSATRDLDPHADNPHNRRRQLTVRLCHCEFRRLVGFADRTRRTFQDILSSATKAYLDIVAPRGGGKD